MSRKPDPARRPQLILDIIEYLHDRTLSSLTMRSLADHLEVSTFTLVYHFGTREELIDAVVEAICEEQTAALDLADVTDVSVAVYFQRFERYWEWAVQPRSLQLQRLVIEAAMAESLHPERSAATKNSLVRWHESALDGLVALGVPEKVARKEARAHANALYGLHYDLIVSRELEIVSEAYQHCMESYRQRIDALVEEREADPAIETDPEATAAVVA
ncbi:TetR/AcrR family transcriptional regulator [Marisediminicola senii]|uniref:TetR/AcrR family transcriptional regulator n=1 Tax=Marisediminicola senii TaxID=2711233 RepID=UPI0013EDD3E8|nr:TetR/AcrR family transcriptional regulator [Marisediminicola senii]